MTVPGAQVVQLDAALALTRDVDTIITARGGLAKPKDLEVHRDLMRDFLESARQAKKAGRTAAEAAKAWRVPPRSGGYTAGKWVSAGFMSSVPVCPALWRRCACR